LRARFPMPPSLDGSLWLKTRCFLADLRHRHDAMVEETRNLREAEVIFAELVELADEGVGALASHAGVARTILPPGESQRLVGAV